MQKKEAEKANEQATYAKEDAVAIARSAIKQSIETQAALDSLNKIINKLDSNDRKKFFSVTSQLEAVIKSNSTDIGTGSDYTIEVYYLEDIITEAKPRALKIVSLLRKEYPDYTINLRFLTTKTNKENKGFNVGQNLIHCESDEMGFADTILNLIKSKKIFELEQPVIQKVYFKSPNYISIFVRNM
ncbi:hypothetical protein BH10BAC2_BH10BAC2_25870 [soil metagenome]